MRSYKPEELFDEAGTLIPELKELAPTGDRRITANPHANGGKLRKPLDLPDFARLRRQGRRSPAQTMLSSTDTLAPLPPRRHAQQHDQLPRLRPRRNRLQQTRRHLRRQPRQNLDGRAPARRRRRRRPLPRRPRHGDAQRAHPRRLVRRLRPHRPPRLLLHLRSLRPHHRLHVQPARQVARKIQARAPLARAHLLHQSAHHLARLAAGSQRLHPPGPRLPRHRHQQEPRGHPHLSPARRQLPALASPTTACAAPTTSTSSSPTRAEHLQYLDHGRRPSTTAPRASASGTSPATTHGAEPDVVMACAGDIPTSEALAAVAILREHCPDAQDPLRQRRRPLPPACPSASTPTASPTASSTPSSPPTSPSSSTSTPTPSLIHKFTYRRTNHDNIHVRGYKEKGNINTPLELAILNQVDRFNLAIDVIDRVPKLQATAAHTKRMAQGPDHRMHQLRPRQRHRLAPNIRNWTWPTPK